MENSKNSKKKKKIQKGTCGTTWSSEDKTHYKILYLLISFDFASASIFCMELKAYIPSSVELFIAAPDRIKFYLLELKL